MSFAESEEPNPVAAHRFGNRQIDPAMTVFWLGLLLALLVLTVVLLRPPQDDLPYPRGRGGEAVSLVAAEDSASLLVHLRELGLWELEGAGPVPPMVLTNFPPDLADMGVALRKRLFLNALAPTALVALAEVEQERAELLRVIGRMDLGACTLDQLLDGAVAHDYCGLSREEAYFLEELSAKYRSEHLDVLLHRVNVVPLSLILAQAALESAWGSSRFVQEGNNIFGIWTWGEQGMVPANRAPGLTHRVAAYDSLLGSVRSYLLMLNRVAAYRTLRDIRQESMDSLALINGLRYYSEKREEYVTDLRDLIRSNQLQRYDALSLTMAPPDIGRLLLQEPDLLRPDQP